jgi:hypothetical protein
MFTLHGSFPPFVTVRLSTGFSSAAYDGLFVAALTVTSFWSQVGEAEGVAEGLADAAA